MHELDDRALESLLRRTLREEAATAPPTLTWEALEARARKLRRDRTIGRRNLTLLGVAAILLLSGAALVAFAERRLDPADGSYQAVLVRPGFEVVVVRPDGWERVVHRYDRASFMFLDAEASSSGWMAIHNMREYNVIEWLLLDAASLNGPARAISPPPLGEQTSGGWSPDGRFSMWGSDGEVILVEPATGATDRYRIGDRLPLVLGWAADGSGLVVGDGGELAEATWSDDVRLPIYNNLGGPYPVAWRVARIDGNPEAAGLPALHPRSLPRSYLEGGSRLQVCDSSERGGLVGCPGMANGTIIVEEPSGRLTTWPSDVVEPARVVDATFAHDGSGVWLLLREADRPALTLARAVAPGRVERIVAIPMRPGVDGSSTVSVAGIAPDDSLVIVRGESRDQPLAVVPTTGGPATYHEGVFAGFARASDARRWGTEPFAAVRGLVPPASTGPAYPPLPSVEQFIADQLPLELGQPVLVHSHEATSVGSGQVVTYDLGEAPLMDGYAIYLRCSGPSDVTLTTDLPDPIFGSDLTNRCLSFDVAVGGTTGVSVNRSVRFKVTADSATAWQVVILDPPFDPETESFPEPSR